MVTHRVTAVLAETDRQFIMDSIAAIKSRLSFLIKLTPDERKSILRLAERNEGFVAKCLEVAAQNPDIFPASFDLEEMRRDIKLYEELRTLILAMNQLLELMNDTSIQVGGEVNTAAFTIYSYVKAAGRGKAYETLAQSRKHRTPRKTKQTEDSETRKGNPPDTTSQ